MLEKPLITLKIEVLEFKEVANFIIGVQLDQLTDEELKTLYSVLDLKKRDTETEMYIRKKADQDGRPNQQ